MATATHTPGLTAAQRERLETAARDLQRCYDHGGFFGIGNRKAAGLLASAIRAAIAKAEGR